MLPCDITYDARGHMGDVTQAMFKANQQLAT